MGQSRGFSTHLAAALAACLAVPARAGSPTRPIPATAPTTTPATPTTTALALDESETRRADARPFFERAKELYAAGRYREAAEQLELALLRDPEGKDLVYNLALVRERVGEPEEAIPYVDRYLAMKLDPAERQRAESFRRRLEGARDEIADKRRKVVVVPLTVDRERAFDSWVWIPAVGAGVAALSGLVLGSMALAARPSGFVAGRDGTFDDLVARTDEAHRYAVGADLAWIFAAAGAGTAAWFYFGRDPVPVATRAAKASP